MGRPAMWAVHRSELMVSLWTHVVLGWLLRSRNSGVRRAVIMAVPTHGSIFSFLEAL